ncbi:hypothetical protein S83_003542 [Arachis hypogaea]
MWHQKEAPLNEDIAASEFNKDGGTEFSEREPDHEEEEVEPIMELPIGLLDEEETIESKSVKRDEDMECMMELLVGLLDEEGTIESEAMWCCCKRHSTGPKQQMEEQEEVQSSEESAGWVKVEISKKEELKNRTH